MRRKLADAVETIDDAAHRTMGDNGEPDERSLHEGVPPEPGQVKYAINGWVRSKNLFR